MVTAHLFDRDFYKQRGSCTEGRVRVAPYRRYAAGVCSTTATTGDLDLIPEEERSMTDVGLGNEV